MKKFFIVALILTMAVGTAYAADETFKIGGQYRMEMYNITNQDYTNKYDTKTSKDNDNVQNYVDQRFRIKADFMPADGVKAVWQADFAEQAWGKIGYRPSAGSDTIMVDKAYVDLTKAMFNVKVGLFGHTGLGEGITTDNQNTGIMATADFSPVMVTAMWQKNEEGLDLRDKQKSSNKEVGTDADEFADADVYGLQVKFVAEAFSAGVFYATKTDMNGQYIDVDPFDAEKKKVDGTDIDWGEDTRNVIGLFGEMALGKLNLWGEIDSFSGTGKNLGVAGSATGRNDVDFVGMNLTLAADMALNEQLKLNFNFHYAPGTDKDDELQITYLTDDAAYNPIDQGAMAWIWGGTGLDPHMVDTNTGATSFDVSASYAVMDNLELFGLVAYLMPNEKDPDGDDNYIDNVTVLTASATYSFLPGTSFSVQYTNTSRSVTNDGAAAGAYSDDSWSALMGLLKVSF